MKWKPGRGGGQIEDRRGQGTPFPIPIGKLGAGGGGIGLIVLLAVLFLSGVFGGGGGFNPPGFTGTLSTGTTKTAPDPDQRLKQFVAFVVADVQQAWTGAFRQAGKEYEPTKLVLFTSATQSGCGLASSQTGPFYCPPDRKVYLDLGFFQELSSRFGAPGDFAQAYVIAHEFGHHVQNLLGISEDVSDEQQKHPDQANELSIRLELQADCFAGVWAHTAAQRKLLEAGDVDEGLGAAAAVGDDRIQKEATGRIDRESWTHGSSEQRVRWFKRGFNQGSTGACETFDADQL